MVEFYLLTFPRFPLRKKEHKSYFGKNRTHDFRTSRCADYLLDHYHGTTSPTPASTPVESIAVATNDLGLPIFRLDVSQAFVQAPLEEEIYMRLPPRCGKISVRLPALSNASIVRRKQVGSGIYYS